MLRNISAPSSAEFVPLLRAARRAGSDAVRLQLTQGFGYDTLGIDAQGRVLPGWAASWDAVFSAAQAEGLAVIPVFGIWGDWNDGMPDAGWIHFTANPLNQAHGGPAATPAELFRESETERAWFAWLGSLVERWQHYPNVIAWEIFSELDLATGANEANATAFAERASDIIRERDPLARPTFASTSDLPLIRGEPWQALWHSRGADLLSLHPYDANLDQTVVSRVLAVETSSAKPIFLGESGVSAAAPDGTTLTSDPGTRTALQQAVWTELVSGAATARALYWEDGYAVYYPATGLAFVQGMNDLDSEAARWVEPADYTGLAPLTGSAPGTGQATFIGNERQVRGYLRGVSFVPPGVTPTALPAIPLTVSLGAAAPDSEWSAVFTTASGEALPAVSAEVSAGKLHVTAPAGFNSLAFVATPSSSP
jgi:hypothetical protein